MNRREFLSVGAGAVVGGVVGACSGSRAAPRFGRLMTVRGVLSPEAMGTTLVHEHAMVDFTPLAEEAAEYDRAEVVETVLPYLLEIKNLGVQTFVDATPAHLGRDPLVLRILSERSGLHVLTNTGYYGARDDVHVPEHAHRDAPEELAQRWIDEWVRGIGDTGIRPGFMKIGVDGGPLSELDAKLVHAAGLAHLETGLTIAAHTGPAEPALEQLAILDDLGVHAGAWIWVHAQAESDRDAHVEAARRGAWISSDGVRSESIEHHVELVLHMRRRGLLGRVLVSQDAGWYSVGEEGGGSVRPYTTLSAAFLPALRRAGFEEADIDRLVRRNPSEAFRIRVRRRH